MANGYTCCIDINRLNSTIETLSSINNCINNVDLKENFEEISNNLNDVNFEHDNCISFYKDKINEVYTELDKIKRNINSLTDAIQTSVEKYNNVEDLTSDDIRDISNLYTDTNSTNNINELLNKQLDIRISNNINEFKNNIDDSINQFLINNKLTDYPKEYKSIDDWRISLENKYKSQNLNEFDVDNNVDKEMAIWRQQKTGSSVINMVKSDYAEHQANIQVRTDNYIKEYNVNPEDAKSLAVLKEKYVELKQQSNIQPTTLDNLKQEIDAFEDKIGVSLRKIDATKLANAVQDPAISSVNQKNVTVIEVPKQEEVVIDNTQPTIINTVPIGLGIAATGISASVGTVIVDSMYDSKKSNVPTSYKNNKEFNNLEEFNENVSQLDDDSMNEQMVMASKEEEFTPYHASRDKETINKFYEGE